MGLGCRGKRPRVLILAFGCNPYAGSESEAGWAVVEAVSEIADTVTLVRPDQKADIDRYLSKHPNPAMRFVEVSPSGVLLRIARSVVNTDRRAWYLAYFAFLRRAKQIARALLKQERFHAAVHAAYGCYWLPTPLVELPLPVVWGPVGGATRTPLQLWPYLGIRGMLGELQKVITLTLFSLLPATQRTWRRAAVRLAETENTRRALPRRVRKATGVVNRGLLAFVPPVPAQQRSAFVLFPSRLEPRKGGRVAVKAFAKVPPPAQLVFAAGGPEEKALRRLARKQGIADRVQFRGFVPRAELFSLMRQAAACLFCGLREEGGMALAEAMLLGSPVVVIGIGGARLIAESNRDPNRVRIIEPAGAKQTAHAVAAALCEFTGNLRAEMSPYLDGSQARTHIQEAVLAAVRLSG